MQFSQAEIRDIMSYLETGKPLPEKYRFYLFENKREVELVWNGKAKEVCNTILPFQTIEQVDEPRNEGDIQLQRSLFEVDNKGRQLTGWTNKLIWGDNKLVLSSLRGGAMRQEIEKAGGIKLIYIDPPFDVGADFSMKVEIGNEEFTKSPTVLEELAYRDTWGKGTDSFISMIYERLTLMRDLLAEDGSIYVHCDWRVSGYMRLIMDEIFGKENFQSEVIWSLSGVSGYKSLVDSYVRGHDKIFYYSKSNNLVFNKKYLEYSDDQLKRFSKIDEEGRRYKPITQTRRIYLDEAKGVPISDVWSDIASFQTIVNSAEICDYPTQKPEKLLKRVIEASSNPGDLVADFFCGSGTTMAVAEKLGRKWIGTDIGKFGIHTTRKRMIGVQRELKKEDQDWRAFEILNIGRYERSAFLGKYTPLSTDPENNSLEERLQSEKEAILQQKTADFLRLIQQAYKGEPLANVTTLHGQKSGRVFAIGPIDLPVGRDFIETVLAECRSKGFTRVDILGFEWEMSVGPHIIEEMKQSGIDLALKYIPRDVFDKRAIERGQVKFFDIAYIEVMPKISGKTLSIVLTDFSVFYTQDDIDTVIEKLRDGKSAVIMSGGQILKISKSAEGVESQELLTKHWTDWIDYWSVDWDYESKMEVTNTLVDGAWKTEKTGNFIFENEWQSFRTKKDRNLELETPKREYDIGGKKRIAIKVIDIFGNDNMKIVEVNL